MNSAGLTFQPGLPAWLIAAVALIGLALMILSYRRSGLFHENRPLGIGLFILKILALVILTLMLMKPELISTGVRREKTDLIVLMDFSESMNIRDEEGNQTRFNTARSILAQSLYPRLSEDFHLRLYGFSSFLRPLSLEEIQSQQMADGSSTDIGGALQQALKAQSGRHSAAVILMTDGVHNTGRHPAEVAPQLASQKIPLYVVGLGGDRQYLDVELNEVIVPELVFENEQVTIGVALTAYGFEGEKTTVRLVRRGISEFGTRMTLDQVGVEEIASQEITLFGQGFRQRVNFQYQPRQVGDHHLTVEVGILPGESVKENNRSNLVLGVVKQQLKVLLVEGRPRWGSGAVFRVLRSDPRFRMDSLTLLQAEEGLYLPIGPGFMDREMWGDNPTRRIAILDIPWEAYDCVILGDISPGLFPPGSLDRLERRVSEGGVALVFIAGEDTFHANAWGRSPLQHLIPVVLEPPPIHQKTPTTLKPTSAGLLHPLMDVTRQPTLAPEIWNRIPVGAGFHAVRQERPGAMKLAEHPSERNQHGNYPLLVYQRTGKGRVLAVLFEDSWLWLLSQDEMVRTHQVFSRFWRGAVRYLISGRAEDDLQGIQIQLEKERIARGETLNLQAKVLGGESLEGARVVIELTAPDGLKEEYRPAIQPSPNLLGGGLCELALRPAQIGQYRILARLLRTLDPIAEDEAVFTVEPTAFEHRDAGLNEELLQLLARETGGRYYHSRNASEMTAELPPSERTVVIIRKTELWNHLILFLLVVLALNAEWIVRKWKDLN